MLERLYLGYCTTLGIERPGSSGTVGELHSSTTCAQKVWDHFHGDGGSSAQVAPWEAQDFLDRAVVDLVPLRWRWLEPGKHD